MNETSMETMVLPKDEPQIVTDYQFPLFKILDDSARDYPNNDFTIFNGASRTYAKVKDTADRVANFLAGKGIKKGDKIAIFLPNIPQFPEIMFGILKAGAVCVNCNPVYTPSELRHQLNDSESKMVFCMDHPQFYDNTVQAINGTCVETVIVCNIKSYLPKVKALLGTLLGKIPKALEHKPGHLMFDDIVAASSPAPPSVEINPEQDTAVMLYTGGTTGVPKGAELTHTNFTYNVKAMFESGTFVHEEGKEAEILYKGGYHAFWDFCPGITVLAFPVPCFTR